MNKISLFLKGVFMGAADIIPGVSGGSIALITGIYDQFIEAIHSVNLKVAKEFFSGKPISALKKIHWGFLLPLLVGIFTSIMTMGRVMNYLLEEQTLYTWSVFFGLILASALVIGKKIHMSTGRILVMIFGAGISYIIVGLVPVNTPDHLWFIFICGAIAICAMILPGISGAFLLLILGKYHYITEIIKDPFGQGHLLVILAFGMGCVVGILSFSRFLRWVLQRWHAGTLAFLTGMMLGSLRKIWPYQEVMEKQAFDGKFFISIVFLVLGFGVILVIDYFAGGKSENSSDQSNVLCDGKSKPLTEE